MDSKTLIQVISQTIQARRNCRERGNTEWFEKHTETLRQLSHLLPHGAGIDGGTLIDLDASHAEKVVLTASFHHMNEAGYYNGWTDHIIVVMPAFRGISLRISGRNRNDIKEYLYETFEWTLTRVVVWNEEKQQYTFVQE